MAAPSAAAFAPSEGEGRVGRRTAREPRRVGAAAGRGAAALWAALRFDGDAPVLPPPAAASI